MFHAEEVAPAPVYDAQQLLADEHLPGRGAWVTVDDPDLGAITVQAPVAQMSQTLDRIDYLGRPLGAVNGAAYTDLFGLAPDRITALRGGHDL